MRTKNTLDISEYNFGPEFGITIAVVADLHGDPFEGIKNAFEKTVPDVICIPGDLCPFITAEHNESLFLRKNNHALEFLKYAVSVAPVYYSRGNNELDWHITVFSELIRIGVNVLDNSWKEVLPRFAIGGLTSANRAKQFSSQKPKTEWLSDFEKYNGYKLLMSHHPEYFDPYIKEHDIDLVISGHAHGGQVRICNQGLYAPGQGIFPKLTSGVYDERLVISRGISRRPRFVPRINNTPELVYIRL